VPKIVLLLFEKSQQASRTNERMNQLTNSCNHNTFYGWGNYVWILYIGHGGMQNNQLTTATNIYDIQNTRIQHHEQFNEEGGHKQ